MKNKKTIIWIYSPSKSWDFGFVDIENENKGYYVHPFNKKDVLPWDKVLAELKTFRWKTEAVIKKILERSDKIFIWHFQEGKKNINWNSINFWFVIIRDKNFKTDIFIPWKYIYKAKNWNLVWVQILSWENTKYQNSKKSPKWKIVEVLWDETKKSLLVDSYILESWFKQSFSKNILNELSKINEKIDIKKELNSWRKDLRNLFTFTIDWTEAKDLDDAISIKKRKNWNFELYVHIADVSNYILENSLLDKHASKTTTSVYLTDRVLPMLPKKLSNNLCSLNPNTKKLTLTCEMLFSKDWICKKTKVYESIIESNFRLTYKEVDEIKFSFITKPVENSRDKVLKIWSTLFAWQKLNSSLVEKIEEALELKKLIEKNRNYAWVLDFDFPETKVILDENKEVLEIKSYPKYESNKLIELFMVSANENVSKLYCNLPFLHRIHPEPNQEDISKLQSSLDLFNISFVLKKFDTKEFSDLLKIVGRDKNKLVLEKIILRTLSKAIYSHKNEWHFGLLLCFYSHFTSPIRRYSDLQIHRIIKENLHKKLDIKRLNHYKTILENIANTCSTQERKAEKLEYRVRDYYVCKFYESKVWTCFDATISGIIDKWFFIILKDNSEGFVDLSYSSQFLYNQDLMQFDNKKDKIFYKLWDEIEVKLIEVDFEQLRLNFEID